MIDPVVVQFWTLIFDEVKRRQEAGEPADYASIMQSLFGLCPGVWQKLPDLKGVDFTDVEVESWIRLSIRQYRDFRPFRPGALPPASDVEDWKQIEGFPDYYVSSLGRVWSTKSGRLLVTSNGRGRKKDRKERPRVTLTRNGKPHPFSVARLVAKAFVPNPDEAPVVDHINEDPTDNRPSNLRWVTAEFNQRAFTDNHYRRTGSLFDFKSRPESPPGDSEEFRAIPWAKAYLVSKSGSVWSRKRRMFLSISGKGRVYFTNDAGKEEGRYVEDLIGYLFDGKMMTCIKKEKPKHKYFRHGQKEYKTAKEASRDTGLKQQRVYYLAGHRLGGWAIVVH